MKEKIFHLGKRVLAHEFLAASIWIFLATGIMNAGNYLYHLLMGRMLGPESYGILYSTIALLYDISIITVPFTFIIVKFVSAYKGKGENKSIYAFYYYLKNKFLVYGLIITILLLILSPFIVSFLRLPNIFFPILIAISFYIGLFPGLMKSTLQGIFNFFAVFTINSIEAISKLLVAVFLVYLGFQAFGAFLGIVIANIVSFIVAFYFMRKERFPMTKGFMEGKQVFKYSVPVFLTTLGLTSLFTTDAILVRNLFSGVDSGYYAALSVLGKIVFFATFPVIMVLFPFVSERHAGGREYKNIFFVSLLMTFLIASTIVLVYYLFPELMVSLLFGSGYLSIAPILWVFGVFIAIYSFCSLLANFYLSIHKTIVSAFIITASILQIVLIFLFHSSLLQVIYVSILSSSLLLASLIIYYPFAMSRQK